MSGRFVRSSKYRHVFGRPTRKEHCYDNIRISRNAWDTNLVKANPKYISVNWEASGGGAFAVIPINEKGRLPEQLPLFRGHTAVVLDTDWSPFNDSLIASASDDGKAFIYKVPEEFTLRTEEGEPVKDVAPVQKLTGHSRKVGHVLFNPAAENVLATSSGDYTVKIWDVEAGSSRLTLKNTDIIQSLSWSANGSLLVTTSRDKKLRIWDVRQEQPAQVVPGHGGAKASRVTWMGEHNRVATTGFSKMSDRQLGLWDIREPKEPLEGFQMLDAISGVCMPFWDDGTQCLYLAGKGDGNIRYFEYANDKFEFLSEYKSSDPQRGIAFLPKRGVNVHENEVMRAFKTVNDSYIEPISFLVPRRAEVFQDDIFPPTVGVKPAMSAAEWFDGKEGLPPKIDLAGVYAGEEPAEVASDYKPTARAPSSKLPSPTKKVPEPEPEPMPPASALRGPPPSMNEQTSSIKDLASKFNDDKEDDELDDDSSDFEEIAKPVDRSEKHAAAAAPQEKSRPTPTSRALGDGLLPVEDKPDDFDRASQVAASQDTRTQIQSQEVAASKSTLEHLSNPAPSSKSTMEALNNPGAASKTTIDSLSNPVPAPKSTIGSLSSPKSSSAPFSDQPIQNSLAEIKGLLEVQTKTMSAQSQEISKLTAEVDRLRTKLGE